MIRAGSGLSTLPDAARAGEEAARNAATRAGSPTSLAFLFVTGFAEDRYPRLVEAVGAATGAEVVGCTASGVLTEEGEVEEGPGVAVLAVGGDGLRTRARLLSHLKNRWVETGRALSRDTRPGDLAVVLPDAASLQPHPFLGALHAANTTLTVVGAGATDDGTAGKALQIGPTGIETDAVAAAVLSGDLLTQVGISQGCRPISAPMTITRCDRNFVLELDGRPALDAFVAAAQRELGGNLEQVAHRIFVGLMPGDSRPGLARGEYLVRNVVGIEPRLRLIAVGEEVDEGQKIVFTLRDAEGARADLNGMLLEMGARLRGRRPAFGLYFNCAARGRSLYDVPDMDTSILQAYLPRIPLAGMFGGCEIAPLKAMPLLHMYSGALALVAEGLDPNEN